MWEGKGSWLDCAVLGKSGFLVVAMLVVSHLLKCIVFAQRRLLFLLHRLSQVRFIAVAFKMAFLPSV